MTVYTRRCQHSKCWDNFVMSGWFVKASPCTATRWCLQDTAAFLGALITFYQLKQKLFHIRSLLLSSSDDEFSTIILPDYELSEVKTLLDVVYHRLENHNLSNFENACVLGRKFNLTGFSKESICIFLFFTSFFLCLFKQLLLRKTNKRFQNQYKD